MKENKNVEVVLRTGSLLMPVIPHGRALVGEWDIQDMQDHVNNKQLKLTKREARANINPENVYNW